MSDNIEQWRRPELDLLIMTLDKSQPNIGRMRNGHGVHFWPCDNVAGFCYIGYSTVGMTREPDMWRPDGSWAYEAKQSPYDLIYPSFPKATPA